MISLYERVRKVIFRRRRSDSKKKNAKSRFLYLEPLEDRQLLAVSAMENHVLEVDMAFDSEHGWHIAEEENQEPVIAPDVFDAEYEGAYPGPLTFDEYCLLYHAELFLQTPCFASAGMLEPQTAPMSSPLNSPMNTTSSGGNNSEYANVYVVTTLQDTVNANDGVLSLREAVALANSATTGKTKIEFSSTLTGTITLNGTALPTLTKSVDIVGPGSDQLTISGNDRSRIFYASKSGIDITIAGMTLTNGYVSGSGGGMAISYAGLTLQDVIIKDSVVTASGGGLYASYNSSITINDCQIIDNASTHASGYGGGAYIVYAGNVSISDSVISGNEARYGGGLALHTNNDNVITNTIISDNTAINSGQGGGIYAVRSSSETYRAITNDIRIIDSQMTGNTSTNHSGAAFFAYSGRVSVENSIVSNNSAVSSAGGLYFYSTERSYVSNSTFENNVSGASGGAILVSRVTSGYFAPQENIAEITSTTFNNNEAKHGGGIAVGGGSQLTMLSSLLANNVATTAGGGIYSSSTGDIYVVNSTISGNKAQTANGQTSANEGGGIYFGGTAAALTVVNSTITDNSAYLGGGVRANGGEASKSVIHNTIIAGNTASANSRGHDVYARFLTTSSNNLIGKNTGLSGVTNNTNGNKVGTTSAPLDPKLGVLRDNGGSTWTHALLENSPAIDAGNASLAVNHRGDVITYDQRGRAYRRTAGTTIDIGAFERDTDIEIIASDNTSFTESGTTILISSTELALSCSDQDGARLEVRINGTAENGTIVYHPNGSISYTSHAGFIGMETIEYTVSRLDGTGETTGTITIEVIPAKSTTANTGTFQAANDSAKIINTGSANYLDVLKNDVFTTAQYGRITNVGTSNKGTVGIQQVDGRDVIVFTPNAGATGDTSFTYTVKNSNGSTKTATVTVNIQSPPSAWQSSNLASGNIALGGSNSSLTPGSSFSPVMNGNVNTSFTSSGTMNSISIPGTGSQNGSGTQGTTVTIVSYDLGNGNYWYHEYVHWIYSMTTASGDHYYGSYTYSLTAYKMTGLEVYSLNVTSKDSYSITVTTNSSNSTSSSSATEKQTGTTTTTISLRDSYNSLLGTVNGHDYRTTNVRANSTGLGTYQYNVTGGVVKGGSNSHSRYTSTNSTKYIYHGTRGNISIRWGTHKDITKDDSEYAFAGSGSTSITHTSGSTSSTLTTSVLTGRISESGVSTESQHFRVTGQYNTSQNRWSLNGSGTVDTSSWSRWKDNSTGTVTEVTNTPTNKRGCNFEIT